MINLCASRVRKAEDCSELQILLIDFAFDQRLNGFPQSLIFHLTEHSREVQAHGLRRLNAIINAGGWHRSPILRMLQGRVGKKSRRILERPVPAELLTMWLTSLNRTHAAP